MNRGLKRNRSSRRHTQPCVAKAVPMNRGLKPSTKRRTNLADLDKVAKAVPMNRGLKRTFADIETGASACVAKAVPMNRGLKPRQLGTTSPTEHDGVAKAVPMNRGLKREWLRRLAEKATDVAKAVPMNRGLKPDHGGGDYVFVKEAVAKAVPMNRGLKQRQCANRQDRQ